MSKTLHAPPDHSSLLRQRDFMLLWAGESASLIGSAVTYVAFPLVAVISLRATAFEAGLLAMAARLPPLVLGGFAGPIVDRVSRRRVMIGADLGRLVLLLWVPISATAGWLTVAQLGLISLAIGSLSLLFNVAYQAFLPVVVTPAQLGDANGKLAASQSVAEVAGPGIAGTMIGLAGPPAALFVDAASYGFSALALRAVAVREPPRPAPDQGETLRSRLASGFRILWRDDVLRTMTIAGAVMAFFSQFQMAVYHLFLVDELRLSPGMIGLLYSISGIFGFIAALLCDRLVERLGVGHLVVGSQCIQALGGICLSMAGGSTSAAVILAGEACFAIGLSLQYVTYASLRQARTVDAHRGRVIGAARFLLTAPLPLAALVAGAVGSTFNLRTTLVTGAIGMTVGASLVARREIFGLHTVDGRPGSEPEVAGPA